MPTSPRLARRLPPLLLAAGLALAAPPAAHAASKLEPPELSRYLRWGPLRVRPGVELRDIGYDDNIFLRSSAGRVGDYTATLAPRLDGLLLLGRRAFLTFDERLEYTLYAGNSDQNFLNQRGAARLTVPLRRMGWFFDLGLDHVNERPGDREDIRTERDETRLGTGVILQPGWRTEIELGATRRDFRYFDPDVPPPGVSSVSELLDRDERGLLLKLDYRLFGRTGLTLELREERLDFDDPDVIKDSESRLVLPGVKLEEGGSLTGSVRLGWVRVDADAAALPDLDEPVGQLRLACRPAPRTRVELEADRRAGFSLYANNLYYVEASAGARLVRYWTRLLGAEATLEAGRLSFPHQLEGAERRDRTRSYGLGVRLRLGQDALGRRVEYTVRVTRYHRNSNLDPFDLSQTVLGVNAVAGF